MRARRVADRTRVPTKPRGPVSRAAVAVLTSALLALTVAPAVADETARRMRIRWDDGHLGDWSWLTLRRACPCALCSGEGNLPGIVTLETAFSEQSAHCEADGVVAGVGDIGEAVHHSQREDHGGVVAERDATGAETGVSALGQLLAQLFGARKAPLQLAEVERDARITEVGRHGA